MSLYISLYIYIEMNKSIGRKSGYYTMALMVQACMMAFIVWLATWLAFILRLSTRLAFLPWLSTSQLNPAGQTAPQQPGGPYLAAPRWGSSKMEW